MIPFLSIDTETPPFDEPQLSPGGRSRISPFVYPPPVLLSYCEGQPGPGRGLLPPAAIAPAIREWAAAGLHFVFHNIAFDAGVILGHAPALRALFIEMANAGRLHDTQILEQLIQIARGTYTGEGQRVKYYTLEELAARRANIALIKDDSIRLTFGQYLGRFDALPEGHRHYAQQDAVGTAAVFRSQWPEALSRSRPSRCRYPIYEDAIERFGPLSERIQIFGSLGLAWLEQFPVTVDTQAAAVLDATLSAESERLQAALVSWGFASITPRSNKFSVKNKQIRELLKQWSIDNELSWPTSESGQLSLDYNHWSQVLPRLAPERLANVESLETLEDRVSAWMRFNRIRKTLSTYLSQYKHSSSHYPSYFNLGARTGRSSARKPSIQQIPKRRGESLRDIFIPPPGHVILEADYKAAELYSLAAIWQAMFGGSNLAASLDAGRDPHKDTARRVWPDFDTRPEDEQERLRQYAKALNFGLPGGMGVKRFIASLKKEGITISENDARGIRRAVIEAEPALKAYLRSNENEEAVLVQAAAALNLTVEALYDSLDAYREIDDESVPHVGIAYARLRKWLNGDPRFTLPTPDGFDPKRDLFVETTATLTGRVRGRTFYSEARNTPFQGLISDVIKLAIWNVYQAWTAAACYRPAMQVHDSIVLYTTDPAAAAPLLHKCMTDASLSVLGRPIPVDFTLFEESWKEGTKWSP